MTQNETRGEVDNSGKEEDTLPKFPAQVKCVGQEAGEGGDERSGLTRHRVRIRSRRVRLCDPDNLVGGVKHLVDALRIAQIIPEDDPTSLELEVTQEKVKTFKEEETIVEVTR